VRVGVPICISIVNIVILIVGDTLSLTKTYGKKLFGSTLWFMNIILRICYSLV